MACHNHPSAPTAAHCDKCSVALCGICSAFLATGTFCEKCAIAQEQQFFVEGRNERASQQREREERARVAIYNKDRVSPPVERSSDKRFITWAVITASFMLTAAMGLYAYPSLLDFDAEAQAARKAAQRLEDCRLVFEEIGYLLEEGAALDPSLRCEHSDVPNIVIRDRGGITVSHPNPGIFGLTALYVTDESHEVIMEQ